MEGRSHYITTLSQANKREFPSNCSSSFVNELDEPIQITAGAKICLFEISIENAVIVSDEDAKLEIIAWLVPSPKQRGKFGKKSVIEFGDEEIISGEALAKRLNVCIWNMDKDLRDKKKPMFDYDRIQDRIWFLGDPNIYITLVLHNKLLEIVGVTQDHRSVASLVILGKTKPADFYVYKGEKRYFADNCKEALASASQDKNYFEYPPNIQDGVDCLMIYINLINDSHIANKRGQVCRFIPFQKSLTKKRTTFNFGGSEMYFEINQNSINTIAVQIRDLKGRFVNLAGYARCIFHVILPP